MASQGNIVQLSFADRAPGSPDQISRVRSCLHRSCVDRYGEDDLLKRLAYADDVEAAFELSMRDEFDSTERHGWLWVAASLGHEESLVQMSIVTQVRAITAPEPRAAAIRSVSSRWIAMGETAVGHRGARNTIDHDELDVLVAAGLAVNDLFPIHPAANLVMD